MTIIAIKLNPSLMMNPDTDIRYTVPSRIQEVTKNIITDDGYDYLDDDSMVIFLKTDSTENVKCVIQILEQEIFSGNKLLETALIGVDSGSGFSVVYPENYIGDFIIE